MKAGEHLTFDAAPGLRLVARVSCRTWIYRYKSPVDGGMRQVRLGSWPSMSAIAAAAEWERLRGIRGDGRDAADEKRSERRAAALAREKAREARKTAVFTVRKLCNHFLERYRQSVSATTYAEAKRLFDRELDDIANVAAGELTRAQAYGLIDGMRGRPVVAKMLRQQLGAAWDQAIDAGKLPSDAPNWWRLVLRGKLPSKGRTIGGVTQGVTKRVLSDAEVQQLLRWMPNFTRDIEDALTLYLWTCCRGAEIVAMERTELSREADDLWWTIPKAKLKMARNPLTVDLRVPLVGRARAIVERRLDSHPGRWLFPSVGRSGHIEQKALGVAVWMHMPYSQTRPEWVRPRLPVTHWAPHDLRRTGRTMLAALGCPNEVGEAILGHLPPGIIGVYNRHQYDSERLEWLRRLSTHLDHLAAA
nr:tyrosine-type recombinase/integrase [Aquabacterium terrae]